MGPNGGPECPVGAAVFIRLTRAYVVDRRAIEQTRVLRQLGKSGGSSGKPKRTSDIGEGDSLTEAAEVPTRLIYAGAEA